MLAIVFAAFLSVSGSVNVLYVLNVLYFSPIAFNRSALGCFIFSPFSKLKKLGSAYDGILPTD